MFELLHTTSTPLWDFGWFDVTRFRATHEFERESSAALLDALVRSDLYSRSFCQAPDPWGTTGNEHGPYALHQTGVGAFRPISHADLALEIESVVTNQDFTSQPSQDQLAPVREWVDRLRRPGVDLFMLTAPAAGSLANGGIWEVFREFVGVESGVGQISVAVIGYD